MRNRFATGTRTFSDVRETLSSSPVDVAIMIRNAADALQRAQTARGETADLRSGVYTLGVIAQRLITDGARDRGSRIPPMLSELVAEMLAGDPDKRPTVGMVRHSAALIVRTLASSLS